MHQEQPVYGSLGVTIEHYLDRTDQIGDVWRIAEMSDLRNGLRTETPEKRHALGADKTQLELRSLVLPLTHMIDRRLEHVGVQAAAKPAIGRYDDIADSLHFAVNQVGMLVIGVGLGQVTDDRANPLGIRTGHYRRRH